MKLDLAKFWLALSKLGPAVLQAILHTQFRRYPQLHRAFTEALLTFDTEAGGETMNLEAATAEKEEQS